MIGAVNLWDPTHVSFTVDLLTAFLLGVVHGVTPDEHTWPITFSYAVGGYSTARGLRAGLLFSLAFAVQAALASELAHLGLAQWVTVGWLDSMVYVVVGIVMVGAGLFAMGRGVLPHLHLPGWARGHDREDRPAVQPRELKWWMPAVHGFIAGWGIDAFSAIIYTTLAPAMPSAATGWLPGFVFGLGTLCVQAAAGAAFGAWAVRRSLPQEAIRNIALSSNSRPVSCIPTGKPAAVNPHGTLIAGRPARLALTVNTSARYIWSGSETRSPTRNAAVGLVGIATTSARSNASS